MKTRQNILVLLLALAFLLASGCTAAPAPTQEPAPQVTAEAPEPIETVAPTSAPEHTEAPSTAEAPQLVWSATHGERLYSVAATADTVAVGEYKVTYIHHLADGSLVNVLAHEHTVDDIAFSRDETILGAGQGYYGVQLSHVVNGAQPQTLGDGHESRLAFSPDGQYVATGNRLGTVWIWDLSTLTLTATLDNPDVPGKTVMNRRILALDYHPSGTVLAATHTDGSIYIWDINNQEILQTLSYEADVAANKTFRFSPKGSELAVAVKEGGDHLIRLYTVEGGEAVRDLIVPERVHNLNFSPDGSLLAVASRQATTIWDAQTGELLYTLAQTITPPDDTPVALTFTPDGGHLAVARWDGTIELWRLPGAEPIPPAPVDIRLPPPLPGDVLFDTGSAEIKASAHAELTSFAEELYASIQTATITFIGHTDSRGDDQSNLELSKQRATAIMTWFQNWADENGAQGWTLLFDGKGESQLKVPDMDADGNFLDSAGALNRRVEIEIELDP